MDAEGSSADARGKTWKKTPDSAMPAARRKPLTIRENVGPVPKAISRQKSSTSFPPARAPGLLSSRREEIR
jgi:hypothetical protein